MPSEKPQLRASTTKEKIGDRLRAAFGNIAEQPLARIADALGVTDFTGLSKPRDPNEMMLGMMPEGPKGFYRQKYPHTQRVRAQWPDGLEVAEDFKGLNEGHALYRARDNWYNEPKVTPVGPHYIDMSEAVPTYEQLKPTMPVQDPVIPRRKYRR